MEKEEPAGDMDPVQQFCGISEFKWIRDLGPESSISTFHHGWEDGRAQCRVLDEDPDRSAVTIFSFSVDGDQLVLDSGSRYCEPNWVKGMRPGAVFKDLKDRYRKMIPTGQSCRCQSKKTTKLSYLFILVRRTCCVCTP